MIYGILGLLTGLVALSGWRVIVLGSLLQSTRTELTEATQTLTDLKTEVSQIYLTEDDRKRIGLPPRGVEVIEIEKPSKPTIDPSKPWTIPACKNHVWCEPWIGRPEQKSNRLSYGNSLDGWTAKLRRCQECTRQEVWAGNAWGWIQD